MRIAFGVTLALLLAAPAWAQSVTFGSRVLVVGDSIARVFEVAGKPDRVVRLENTYGGAVAERFEYYVGSKVISVTVQGSKVVDVSEST